MKRILLITALLAAPLAQAQSDYYQPERFNPAVSQLQNDLERLRQDPVVIEHAGHALARAEGYIADLANAPYPVTYEEIALAERLLQRVERVTQRRSMNPQREYVVVDDPRARDAERRAREDSEYSRASATAERERALASQLEMEQERDENARLRAELGQAQTRVTDRGVVLTLGDVLFEVGKADLKAGAARNLDNLVGAMHRDPELTVIIEGHTDSTGRHMANITLSERRAEAVHNFLTGSGVSPQSLKAVGLGPDFPVATNKTAEGRQQNRRVELVVQNSGSLTQRMN